MSMKILVKIEIKILFQNVEVIFIDKIMLQMLADSKSVSAGLLNFLSYIVPPVSVVMDKK